MWNIEIITRDNETDKIQRITTIANDYESIGSIVKNYEPITSRIEVVTIIITII